MSEQQAWRLQAKQQTPSPGAVPAPMATAASPEHRSGVHAKGRRAGSGWGLILVDLAEPARAVNLTDGAVVGAESADAKVEGRGVARQHARVIVRADGCYLEDLSEEALFVDGVKARRIGVTHGAVVRLGEQLSVFVERDLDAYAGPAQHVGGIVHGPKQRRDWIDPALDLVQRGSCVAIEGGPGVGKRMLAKLCAEARKTAGEVVFVDGDEIAKTAQAGTSTPPSPLPKAPTYVAFHADRLPRPKQLEIAHAIGRNSGAVLIATFSEPLDRASGDGRVAPWFTSLFTGRRIHIPSLESRREDIPAIVRSLAERRGIELSRVTPSFLEAVVRAGWPRGVPQLDEVLDAAAQASDGGPLEPGSITSKLSRPTHGKLSLPPATDPGLARARLEDALARANGSVASAARSLGMSRQAIYREAERLGLDIARRRARA